MGGFIFLTIIAAVAIAWLNDWPRQDNSLPIYTGLCVGKPATHESCKEWALVESITFHISPLFTPFHMTAMHKS